ncbi:hypothetical protein EC973_001801 [Apophysomyces ossiformis]|uniref:DUF4097 domain-containing protein n=1 Tax=Apophysomyces ossiformis TaxID=679940 RepID=A0A8H7BT71_9FUNG|nr:hypothetical protein EC973_001801 [Apophysomyces ossiformis]
MVGNIVSQNVVSDSIELRTQQGDISGRFSRIGKKLLTDTSYGNIEIDIADNHYDSKKWRQLKASTISGDVHVKLPKTFTGHFNLRSYTQIPIVLLEDAHQLRFKQQENKNWIRASYGKRPKSNINLSTIAGYVQLQYF